MSKDGDGSSFTPPNVPELAHDQANVPSGLGLSQDSILLVAAYKYAAASVKVPLAVCHALVLVLEVTVVFKEGSIKK